MKREKRAENYDQRSLGLKIDDKAFFITSGGWSKPVLVTLTGFCDEGKGYEAYSPAFKEQFSDSDGSIHTCNGFLTSSRKVARAESLRTAIASRQQFAERQALCTKWIQYLDYVIANKGKA